MNSRIRTGLFAGAFGITLATGVLVGQATATTQTMTSQELGIAISKLRDAQSILRAVRIRDGIMNNRRYLSIDKIDGVIAEVEFLAKNN